MQDPKDPCVDFDVDWASLECPVLTLPVHAYGSTGYLDGLRPEDMEASVMKGIDAKERAFVAVRAQVLREDGEVLQQGVEVYFQRFSRGLKGIWVSGGELELMISNMKASDRERLKELIEKGSVSFRGGPFGSERCAVLY